ncbi:MAG: hypothetical protein ACLFTL_02965 [Alphaproteobacteria bacterium]
MIETPDRRGAPDGPHLFRPLASRSLTLCDRILVAPRRRYAAADDRPVQHLARRAAGGAGLVFMARRLSADPYRPPPAAHALGAGRTGPDDDDRGDRFA